MTEYPQRAKSAISWPTVVLSALSCFIRPSYAETATCKARAIKSSVMLQKTFSTKHQHVVNERQILPSTTRHWDGQLFGPHQLLKEHPQKERKQLKHFEAGRRQPSEQLSQSQPVSPVQGSTPALWRALIWEGSVTGQSESDSENMSNIVHSSTLIPVGADIPIIAPSLLRLLTHMWVCVLLVILVALPIAVRLFGGVPEIQAGAEDVTTKPPALLIGFTGVVCIGALANVTVVIPTAAGVADSVPLSGYVIGAYSAGALLGLPLFKLLKIRSLRLAYLLHACCMVLGNSIYTVAAIHKMPLGLVLGRAVTGLEGGVMYNTNLAIVHFARGRNKTSYLVLYQFFISLGIILGPVLSSGVQKLCTIVGAFSAADVYVNGFMVAWGAVLLVALLMAFPADAAEFEDVAGVPLAARARVAEHESVSPTGALHEVAPDEPVQPSHLAGQGMGLALTLFNASLVRTCLRLAWESGAMVVFQNDFGWSIAYAGLAYGFVCAFQACTQLAFRSMSPANFRTHLS